MIVYQKTKREFIDDVRHDRLAEGIRESVQAYLNRKTPKSEFDSWRNSGVYMRDVFEDGGVADDCSVAIEYQVPGTAKRIDYILSGLDDNDTPNICIVELKQWSSAQKTTLDATVLTRVGKGKDERHMAHPSYQAWSYARLLQDFNEYIYENEIHIQPCAFLHNYPQSDNNLTAECYSEHVKLAPIFRKGEAPALGEFLARYVSKSDGGQTLYNLDHGRIRPSKSLVDALVSLLNGNQEFVLIDEQKVAYETVMHHAANQHQGKTVVIVEGGPGTGKSVVAINLLVGVSAAGKTCHYVTRNAAPREVFQAKLTGTMSKTRFSNLFKGSGSYIDASENGLDVLVVDEAHRLNEKSGMFRKGENQIKEVINAAQTSVFFVDPRQKVTLLDIGSVEEIEKHAKASGASILRLELPSQFRCAGSDGYLAWVDHTLGVRDTANDTLKGVNYDFRLFDDPNVMKAELDCLNDEGHMARILAGYCWDWISKKDPGAFDIELPEHDFRMRWNDFNLGQGWIMHEESKDQVGCIHTSQGLEVDYVGVIIGPDLKVVDGEMITDPYAHPGRDKNLQGFKKRMKEDPEGTAAITDELIRNTYRTLLTRGMKGCFVFCTDKALSARFKKAIGG
jgi:DUF2075 family protein/Mrp family chromosome partitioning ATPase